MDEKNSSIHVLPTETYFALVRQMLSETGQAYVRVTGTSMWPLLRHLQDGVIIQYPGDKCRNVRFGDIVLFDRQNGRYALHRVIRKGKTGFSMAGDNQWYMDINLPYRQIVGVVTSIDRGGRRIARTNLLLRGYSFCVAFFAKPRIYLCRVIRQLLKLFNVQRKQKTRGDADEN